MRARLLDWVEPYVGEFWAGVLIPDQPVLSGIGGTLAIVVAAWWARRSGLVWWKALVAGGAAALGAVVFARVFWLFTALERVAQEPSLIFNPFRGGQVSFGALAGAGIGAALALWWLKAPIKRYADVLAPPGLFGIAMARVGCLMRGCDYGVPSQLPWALRYPDSSQTFRVHVRLHLAEASDALSAPVHPFPLYLGAWAALVGLLALWKPDLYGSRPGQRAVGTGLLYLLGRFCLEFLRQPGNAPTVFGPFNMGHLFALVCMVGLAGLFAWLSRAQGSGTSEAS